MTLFILKAFTRPFFVDLDDASFPIKLVGIDWYFQGKSLNYRPLHCTQSISSWSKVRKGLVLASGRAFAISVEGS